ncbi:ABC transporter ATP-binding protein [uncultured Propionibacterium sp.]|uniref:ABC transporter ATP-binding protein n=1 Tax=uncultured Propionibacterium sp. TaxID=218066 RepID=UPI0029311A68|nr:ABC transporter ATP-binding protein [uncultured Propionibacterium sp.]
MSRGASRGHGTGRAPEIRLEAVAAQVQHHVVVRDVGLTIPGGTKLALVGTNGAGKSTLLRAIAGITEPAAGRVLLDGNPVHAMKPRERARLISFVSQEETPPDDLRLGEMVALGRIPYRSPWSMNGRGEMRIVRESLGALGLGDRLETPCTNLSGGERRRAMIARGLAQRCPVLVLDEPTNHLDIAWQLRLLDLLAAQPATVIAAIHDIDTVLRHFDLVAVLHGGLMRAFGEPAAVLGTGLMGEAFAVEALQIPHPRTHQPHLLISRGKDNR